MLRLVVTIDGDIDKAANVTVELMDALGSGSAMDSKVTDNHGNVNFRTLTGLHRVRITGPDIQPYEGEIEIMPNEASHLDRIRVRRTASAGSSQLPAGKLVSAASLRIPSSAKSKFDKAAQAMSKHQWRESQTLLEEAIRAYPQYELAYNGLGAVQMQLNDVEGAKRSFTKALEINPDFPGANRNLARILLSERNANEALPLLKRSLATEPDNIWALANAANSELLLHDYSNAILHARKAHSMPHEAFPIVHMIAARALEATQKPSEALAEYQLYLQEDPKGRDAPRARQAIERLGAPNPGNVVPH